MKPRSAVVATALGEPVGVRELVRLGERVAALGLVGEQARILLGLVERGLCRGDDRLDLVLVTRGRREGVDPVDLLLDARDHGVGHELLLRRLTRRLLTREHLLAGRLDLLVALGADRVALRDELALGKGGPLSAAGPAGARRRRRGSASTPCQGQPCDQPREGHDNSCSHLAFLLWNGHPAALYPAAGRGKVLAMPARCPESATGTGTRACGADATARRSAPCRSAREARRGR